MTIELIPLIVGVIALGFGSVLGYLARQSIAKRQRGTAEAQLTKILTDAKAKGRDILIEARDKSVQILEDAKKDEETLKKELLGREKRIFQREEFLDKKNAEIEAGVEELRRKAEKVKKIRKESEELRAQELKELERVSGLSSKDAKEELVLRVEKEVQGEIHERVKKLETEGKETLDKRAQDIFDPCHAALLFFAGTRGHYDNCRSSFRRDKGTHHRQRGEKYQDPRAIVRSRAYHR